MHNVARKGRSDMHNLHARSRYPRQATLANTEREPCSRVSCARIQNEIRNAISGASEVHSALCSPERQRKGRLEIASRVVPARHIGGDFVLSFDAGSQAIAVVGDLMGKGLSAAMWITHLIDLVYRAGEGFESTAGMMERLNNELVRSRVHAPLTSAFLLAADPASGAVSYSSGGHPPAVLVRSDGSTELLNHGGPLLGVFADARYASKSVQLCPGDAVVAFSDGLVEAHNNDDEEFSTERVCHSLAANAGASASDKLRALLTAADDFAGGKRLDDISVVVVQHT